MSQESRPTAVGTPTAVQRFLESVSKSLNDESFVRLVLSNPISDQLEPSRIEGRLIRLRGTPALSLTRREARRDTTRNLSLSEVSDWLSSQICHPFQSCLLETTRQDWQLSAPPNRPTRLITHAARKRSVPDRSHDRPRQDPFGQSPTDWLHALGLVDASGSPFPKRADKHRQILRYAEIVSHLLRDTPLPPNHPIRVVDMGCGRGYLTFAVWHLLARELGLPDAIVTGVESRPELVEDANQQAQRLQLAGLRFQVGTIAETDPGPIDLLIALHACNTATDDALCQGVRKQAKLILVAPCCHQELRPKLVPPRILAPLLRHGLLAERFSEWLTDGLRALYLQAAGYRTKLIEFVGSEHTPKNLLLAGIRSEVPLSAPEHHQAREQIAQLKAHFGLPRLALDPLLDR